MSKLTSTLAEMTHLAKDSRSFLNIIHSFNYHSDNVFCKGDVNEFYMSGNHPSLARSSERAARSSSWLVGRAVQWMLQSQRVGHSQLFPERVWMVLKGSGMG